MMMRLYDSELVKWYRLVDPQQLAEFKRVMTEEVIPEIVKAVEERYRLAAESREWQINR